MIAGNTTDKYSDLEESQLLARVTLFLFLMGCGASTSGDPNGSMGKLHSSIRWFDPTGELPYLFRSV